MIKKFERFEFNEDWEEEDLDTIFDHICIYNDDKIYNYIFNKKCRILYVSRKNDGKNGSTKGYVYFVEFEDYPHNSKYHKSYNIKLTNFKLFQYCEENNIDSDKVLEVHEIFLKKIN